MLPLILGAGSALANLVGQYVSNESAYEQSKNAIEKRRKQLQSLLITPQQAEANVNEVSKSYNTSIASAMNTNAFNARGVANKETAMGAMIAPLLGEKTRAIITQKAQDSDFNRKIGIAMAETPDAVREPINVSQSLASGLQGAIMGMELNKADLFGKEFDNSPKQTGIFEADNAIAIAPLNQIPTPSSFTKPIDFLGDYARRSQSTPSSQLDYNISDMSPLLRNVFGAKKRRAY